MLAARSSLLRRTAVATRQQQQRRRLNAKGPSPHKGGPHKRALSKQQLEGKKADVAAVASSAAPPRAAAAPAAPKGTPAGGGPSAKAADVGKSGGGGGAAFPLLALAGVGVGGAWYGGLIPFFPEDYLPDSSSSSSSAPVKKIENVKVVNVAKELKEAVEEVTNKKSSEEEVVAAVSAPVKEESATEEIVEVTVEEEISLDHPEGGSRVDIDKISTFYQTVNEGRAIQAEEEARDAAAKATQYNEGDETQADPMSALNTAANAMSELQSTTSLQNSKTLSAAKAALRSDMDAEYFKDLDTLSEVELRIRVVQLATEMSDRTKWEALRLKEFLSMKEKEVGAQYMEILQKQRLEFENLLAQRLREQEDSITRQANAALAAKEESVQSLMKATGEAREKEMKDVLTEETKKIADELNLQYGQKMQNELAKMKQGHVAELEAHFGTMKELQSKLGMLESKLEVSRTYESGSRRAHRVSAAALALASKLEGGDGAAVEFAALKGACDGEEGVIASAVRMIPKTAEKGVPTVADLQARFDESYSMGRQAAMVPEGRAGLEGQLMGMIFAKLSVPPSPDAAPKSEEEGSVADGILSLARKYVQLGDLEKAVEQLDKLKGQTAYVMNDWKSNAADRVCTERALKVIKLECSLLNKELV